MNNAHLATGFGGHNFHTNGSLALDRGELMRLAPAIFAEGAHEDRSAKYAYIPTVQVLDGLAREGFRPFFALQSGTRKEGHREYTKHLVRLRHESQALVRGGDCNEIILINSHNGSSGYQMLGGAFRSVCTNTMVCGEIVDDIRIPHRGDVQHAVIAGAFSMLDQFGRIDESKEAFKATLLTSGEQEAFARAAIVARFDVPTYEDAPIAAHQANAPRRWEDRGQNDLWVTFNRVQENLIQGGLNGKKRDANGKLKNTTTRAIAAIDQNTALNRALWTLAEGMRAMKAA